MRCVRAVLACSLLFLGACGSDESGDEGDERFPVRLQSGSDVEDGEPCGADDPECPAGTFCAVVYIDGDGSEPTCVSEDICDEASCHEGADCTVAESFPAQVFCSGTCTGSDCDDPVSS
jgi:hypothetical protein